jgi:hypothetical protein
MPARTRLILSLCAVIFVTFTQRAAAQASSYASGTADIAAVTLAPASLPTTATTAPAPLAGPTMQSLSVGLQQQSSALPETERTGALAAQRRNAGLGQAQAMMIVGGAAILVGAIVGDSPGQIIMIGGAVVGLVGLYKYLQ